MPNINNSIIDFNDFNAEPQLLRDIQDGKAIAFYSFAHLLLDTSGKPYTLPTGLYISGAYDTLQQLQSAFPTGNTNLYIVNADKYIYYWNGSAWTKGGTIDATYAFGVELQVPNTATNGTLTQEQFNQLSNNENAYILFNNERYLLMDKGHEADTWGYSHLGADITGAKIKVITINTSNRSWVLTDEEFVKDGTISTQKIQDGAVTTQKLSSDVSLQIRKNDFASRFNSDRLNVLEAQINADKNTIEYTSDKALEITCNGANIIDCNAHFKKVEGQTKTYSPNLLKMPNSEYTEERFTIKSEELTGKITLTTKTFTDNLTIFFDNNFTRIKKNNKVTIANIGNDIFNIEATKVSGGNDCYAVQPHSVLVLSGAEHNAIRIYVQLPADSSNQNKTFTFKPMILEGQFTYDDLPPFQPYDNTLVNSKATFVSTGRNLYSGVGNDGHIGFDIYNGTIPKGTYYLLFRAKTTNEPYDIRVYYGGDNFEVLARSMTTERNVYNIPVKEGATRIYFNSWNKDYQMSDIMLVAEKINHYEPYIKNISQYDIELGAYDYIENGNLIKQTSDMVTLNGSESWQYESSQDKANTKLYSYPIFEGLVKEQSIMSNSTLRENEDYWYGDTPCIGINNNGRFYMRLDKTSFPTVESVKQWLASNPITLIYKKATPTITPIVVPNGIVSYKNGLTSQEIKGKYLPYKYTAKYVNGGAK